MPPKQARATRQTTRRHANGSLETAFRVELAAENTAHADTNTPAAASLTNAVDVHDHIRDTAHGEGCNATNGQLPPETPVRPRNLQHCVPSSPATEVFPSPSPGSSLRGGSPERTPPQAAATIRRPRFTPRTGPHSPLHPRHSLAKGRVGSRNHKTATDVHTFFVDDGVGTVTCMWCRLKESASPGSTFVATVYSKLTSTSGLRNHLRDHHLDDWVSGCDKLKIEITAKGAQKAVGEYRRRHNQAFSEPVSLDQNRKPFTQENFIDAIVDFIVSDDQSLNVIESPKLRAIFLMLREQLVEANIPSRTTIRARIIEMWHEHLNSLEERMLNAIGKVSFTSDLWSDINLTPFMAVTAHWIETQEVETPEGKQYILNLCADLAAFHYVPGRHSGIHLATAFLETLDRINLAPKIGWVTLDNASNNDTLMSALEGKLLERDIPFDRNTSRIRCYPHIVNLACKAVLTAISSLDYHSATIVAETCWGRLESDPIPRLQTMIRVIRFSPMRRQCFSGLAIKYFGADVQLLRNVDTRWSSMFLMIKRAIMCKPVIIKFFSLPDFEDLRLYYLDADEWAALQDLYDILSVPHAFQQRLSNEKTPSLGEAIRSFSAIIDVWKEYQESHPETRDIVEAGIDKLDDYLSRTGLTPAYTVAMILNPGIKLTWHREHVSTSELNNAKRVFINELRQYHDERLQIERGTGTTRDSQSTRAPPPRTPARARTARGHPQTPRLAATNAAPTAQWADKLFARMTTNSSTPANASDSRLRSLESEVDAYLLDSQTGTSVIGYWQENQLRYPTLFRAALDYLPIQGSAVPCERVFSSGKETMTMRRNRIGHDLMEALQMLKFSLRTGKELNFTEAAKEEEEVKILEDMSDTEFDNQIGHDRNFIRSLLLPYLPPAL